MAMKRSRKYPTRGSVTPVTKGADPQPVYGRTKSKGKAPSNRAPKHK